MLAGAIVYLKRTKVEKLVQKIALKVLKGVWGNSRIFRLRNIPVATERCVVFVKKFPHKNITLRKLTFKKFPPSPAKKIFRYFQSTINCSTVFQKVSSESRSRASSGEWISCILGPTEMISIPGML